MCTNEQNKKKHELIDYLISSKYDLENKVSELFEFRQKYYNLNIQAIILAKKEKS